MSSDPKTPTFTDEEMENMSNLTFQGLPEDMQEQVLERCGFILMGKFDRELRDDMEAFDRLETNFFQDQEIRYAVISGRQKLQMWIRKQKRKKKS